MDVYSVINAAAVLSLVGLCLKQSNGNVKKPECHSAMDGVKKEIKDLDTNLDRRFTDLKDYIKNGER